MSQEEVEPDGRIGRYVLEQELGRGGQGTVYLARDVELGREVALKILAARRTMSAEVRLRFKGEAEKAARVDHPNVARVYEWGEDEGVPYIAMELVRGETLAVRIRESARVTEGDGVTSELHLSFSGSATTVVKGTAEVSVSETVSRASESQSSNALDRRAIQDIAELIESAARGLHDAHERGLIHRDIKPGNLMVTEGRGLVILDFGLARDDDDSAETNITVTGDIVGTPAYMSPEQLIGERSAVDRRSDVYSLGVTLFECLALRRPFEAASRQALFQEIIGREAPDIRKLNRRVSADLAVIVNHALAKHPDQRYPTALALAEDLRRFREREPIVARPVGPMTRAWRWAQRKPALAGLLSTILVALVAIATITSLNARTLGRLNRDLEVTSEAARRNADEARRSAQEAEKSAVEAQGNERRAREETEAKTAALEREQKARQSESKALSEYQRMADTRRLANARAAADTLWPEHPDLIPRLDSWQVKYAPLFARLDGHRAALDSLRDQALPYTEEARLRDFATETAEIARLEELKTQPNYAKFISKIDADIEKLRAVTKGRRSWDFGEDVDLQFRHDTLEKLVVDLEAFVAEGAGVVASVERRRERSGCIRKESLEEQAPRWKEAIVRVSKNPLYGGLSLRPQLGLIPLGPDPKSGLEEFLDWRTHDWSENDGKLPERDEAGRIAMKASRGLVLVLIPGGSFSMGAQRDPNKPNFDPEARPDEAPVREIVLSPYFISKYEMTQGQWERFDGVNPSSYGPKWHNARLLRQAITLCHPVEEVNWNDCTHRLRRIGLIVPTEAQWERAARAGADPATVWTGTSKISELARFANISGLEGKSFFPLHTPEHRDNWALHGPVGSFAPNGFGLFDTTGNVGEWCRDSFEFYDRNPLPGDARGRKNTRLRTFRGGGFGDSAALARLAMRFSNDVSIRGGNVGVRPARRLSTD